MAGGLYWWTILVDCFGGPFGGCLGRGPSWCVRQSPLSPVWGLPGKTRQDETGHLDVLHGGSS